MPHRHKPKPSKRKRLVTGSNHGNQQSKAPRLEIAAESSLAKHGNEPPPSPQLAPASPEPLEAPAAEKASEENLYEDSMPELMPERISDARVSSWANEEEFEGDAEEFDHRDYDESDSEAYDVNDGEDSEDDSEPSVDGFDREDADCAFSEVGTLALGETCFGRSSNLNNKFTMADMGRRRFQVGLSEVLDVELQPTEMEGGHAVPKPILSWKLKKLRALAILSWWVRSPEEMNTRLWRKVRARMARENTTDDTVVRCGEIEAVITDIKREGRRIFKLGDLVS